MLLGRAILCARRLEIGLRKRMLGVQSAVALEIALPLGQFDFGAIDLCLGLSDLLGLARLGLRKLLPGRFHGGLGAEKIGPIIDIFQFRQYFAFFHPVAFENVQVDDHTADFRADQDPPHGEDVALGSETGVARCGRGHGFRRRRDGGGRRGRDRWRRCGREFRRRVSY